MKRSIALLPAYACTASVLLVLCLFVVAGCSEGSGAGATAPTPGDLEEAEFAEIMKTAKTLKAVTDEVGRKTLEKAGVVVTTKTPRKTTKKRR